MEAKTAEAFFYNVNWFNTFLSDMKSLYDKLGDKIEEETGCSDRWIYYYKPDETPQIPSAYFMGFANEDLYYLQVIGIFEDQYIKNEYLKVQEPSLIVIQHDSENNPTWLGGNILQNYDTKDVVKKGEYVSGILDYDPKVKFRAFSIPIEKFSEYKEETVYEELISKLDW
jgi:hypothetical protein